MGSLKRVLIVLRRVLNFFDGREQGLKLILGFPTYIQLKLCPFRVDSITVPYINDSPNYIAQIDAVFIKLYADNVNLYKCTNAVDDGTLLQPAIDNIPTDLSPMGPGLIFPFKNIMLFM